MTEQEIRERIADYEEAIADINDGSRLVEVTTGDRHERRQEARVSDIRAEINLLKEQLAAVTSGSATPRPRAYRATFSKGL